MCLFNQRDTPRRVHIDGATVDTDCECRCKQRYNADCLASVATFKHGHDKPISTFEKACLVNLVGRLLFLTSRKDIYVLPHMTKQAAVQRPNKHTHTFQSLRVVLNRVSQIGTTWIIYTKGTFTRAIVVRSIMSYDIIGQQLARPI